MMAQLRSIALGFVIAGCPALWVFTRGLPTDASHAQSPGSRPDVLIVLTDQQRADAFGAAGARDVQTRLEVHTLLASLYAERGQFGNALREADEASRADPARSALLRFKGTIYQAARRPAEAAQAFRAAWLVEPGDPLNAYGLVVRRSGHTTPPELERAIQTLANIEQELVRGQRTSAQSPFADLNTLNAIGDGWPDTSLDCFAVCDTSSVSASPPATSPTTTASNAGFGSP